MYLIGLGHVPGWVTAGGLPATWEHYQIGLSRLAMLPFRQQIRDYDAARMSQVVDNHVRDKWLQDLRSAGGFPR